jgi:hypothetical protein
MKQTQEKRLERGERKGRGVNRTDKYRDKDFWKKIFVILTLDRISLIFLDIP